MAVSISVPTKGNTDIIDITSRVQNLLDKQEKENGLVHLFVIGSTVSLTTIEPDENLYEDFKQALEKIAPYKNSYKHHKTWGDDNGASHLRASLLGPSISIPFKDKKLLLGTWQKIVLIDFDTRERKREIVSTIISID